MDGGADGRGGCQGDRGHGGAHAIRVPLVMMVNQLCVVLTGGDGSDVLDAKFVGPAREEFIELRLGGPDDLVL
jgi:hypothetical protein